MSDISPIELLIVEDSDSDLDLALNALQTSHLANNISVVRDGAEALDFLFKAGKYANRPETGHPKVVLLDLNLPKVSGLEVLRAIRSREETKTLPVVVLTSSKQDQDIIDTYRLGVNSYIVKPVDFLKFAKAIAEVGHYWLVLNQPPRPSS